VSRALVATGDNAYLSGDRETASRSYRDAIAIDSAHPAVRSLAAAAHQAIEGVISQRGRLIDDIAQAARAGVYTDWCSMHTRLSAITLQASESLVRHIEPDDHTHFSSDGSAPKALFVDAPAGTPGGVFRVASSQALDTTQLAWRSDVMASSRVPASIAGPIVSNVVTARSRLLALESGLTLTGESAASAPFFRYAYLRDRANDALAHAEALDAQMASIEARLDDQSAIFVQIRRQQDANLAELAALKVKIAEKQRNVEVLGREQAQVDAIRKALQAAVNACEVEWFVAVAGGVLFITGAAIGLGLVFSAADNAVDAALLKTGELGAALGALANLGSVTITCANVIAERDRANGASSLLDKTLADNKAELQHLSLAADALEAAQAALVQELTSAQQDDAARLLGVRTLSQMRSQMGRTRDAFLTRARTLAQLAERAFNVEHGAALSVIRTTYANAATKDHGDAQTLRSDLQSLENYKATTGSSKRQQMVHTVSLRRHYPLSLIALKATGSARWSLDMADVDRAFPGAYMQRIREVQVEVLTPDGAVPARGYLSNDGLSSVRVLARGSEIDWPLADLSNEPDEDIALLCYKRLQYRQPPETAAFTEFDSALFQDRRIRLQQDERNAFEHSGVETSWTLELLPDQPFDLSKLVDVVIHIQYDALFDAPLRTVVAKKRYSGRQETAGISLRDICPDSAGDIFTSTVTAAIPRDLLEAPQIDKRIVDVGFVVRPKNMPALTAPATLLIGYGSASPVQVSTDSSGIVATAAARPAGTGTDLLAAAARGKSLHLPWSVTVANLPAGLTTADVADVVLLAQYEFVTT
jgi:hypothetical protein